MKGLGLGLGISETISLANVELTVPTSFPVTLQRNALTYSIVETGADFLDDFTGSTLYIAPSTASPAGSDANDGLSAANPKETIDAIVIAASALDVISMVAGEYLLPSNSISKHLAFNCTSGVAYIGTFHDLTGETIAATGGDLYNVSKTTSSYSGFLRTDNVQVAGVYGSAFAVDNNRAIAYQAFTDTGIDGVMSVFTAGGTSNFSLGTTEDLQDLVDAGSIKAWRLDSTNNIVVDTAVNAYFGNCVIACNAGNPMSCSGSAKLYMSNCEVYGGTGSVISHNGSSGGQVILLDCFIAGGGSDTIDYDGSCTAVEARTNVCWPDIGTSDNATTAHVDANVLRCNGVMRGGSRTCHDVNDGTSFIFSCSIGDPVANDKTCLLNGFSTIPDEDRTMDYGDITFLDTFSDGGITDTLFDAEAGAVTKTDLTDAWPY